MIASLILGKSAFGNDGLVFPLMVPAIGGPHRNHRHLLGRATVR
jgi:hypothetical protein